MFPTEALAAQSIGGYVKITREIKNKEIPEDSWCNRTSHIMMMAQITELKNIINLQKKKL